MRKAMDDVKDKIKEYQSKWYQDHKDDPKRKAQTYKAHRTYLKKKEETDPEWTERRKAYKRADQKKRAAKQRAAMTEEELNEYRRKERERIAAYRAKKKAEKLAQQQQQAETKPESE